VDGEQILSLVAGVAVAILGVAFFIRVRQGAAGGVFAASYAMAGLFISLWPPQTDLWLDRTIGVTGAGVLLWACGTTLCVGLQATFHFQIRDRGVWWVRATPTLAAGVMVVYVTLWVLVHLTTGPATSSLLYDGYHGDLAALLVWNMVVGVSIAFVSGVAAREELRKVGGRRATDAVVLGGVYLAGVLYGSLIGVQALASHLGYGATTVVPILRGMRAIAVILATGCAIWAVIGADLWTIGTLWRRTYHLRRQWDWLTFLLVVLSDRLVWRHAPEAADPIAQLVRQCVHHNQPAHPSGRQTLIALQAARRITWRRGVLVSGAWNAASPKDHAEADRSIAAEAALDVATGNAPVSDIGHVILVALAHVSLPSWLVGPLPAPTAGHVAAAALLAPYFGETSDTPGLSPALSSSLTQRTPDIRAVFGDETTGRWLRRWHRVLSGRHAQAETDLIVCSELIEDYVLQIDAPDDNDLAISVWTLDSAQDLSPFQAEIAQRTSQILALFGSGAVRCAPWSPSTRVTKLPLRLLGHRSNRSPSESKVTLWCAIAMVLKAVLDPASIPIDGVVRRGSLDGDGWIVAGLIREAAQGSRL